MIRRIDSLKLLHTFREGNQIADRLANQGRSVTSSRLLVLESPSKTLDLLDFYNGPGTIQRFAKNGMG